MNAEHSRYKAKSAATLKGVGDAESHGLGDAYQALTRGRSRSLHTEETETLTREEYRARYGV